MTQINVTSILASKLYDTVYDTLAMCSSFCVTEELCHYVVVDNNEKRCSLYGQGQTIYNVSQFSTFVAQARIFKVSETGLVI